MKTGIIFDIDGTLWNACAQITESWNIALSKFPEIDVRLDVETMKTFMGRQLMDILKCLVGNLDEETMEQLAEQCSECEIDYIRNVCPGVTYPGAADVIKELSEKYYIGIVSNCQDGYIEAFIEQNGLGDFVDGHECPGKTEIPKWQNIKKLIDDGGLDRAFYVGDTMGDCIATKKAGAQFIFAAYGFGEAPGEQSISDISELPKLIEKLTRE